MLKFLFSHFFRSERTTAASDVMLILVSILGFFFFVLSLLLLLISKVLPADTFQSVILQGFLLNDQYLRFYSNHRFRSDDSIILFRATAEVVEFLQHLEAILAGRRWKIITRC